jgi:glucose-6-phosphate 1-dehydrogenase
MSQSSILILFGSTGDLVANKILPALDQWYEETKPYGLILCLGRRAMDAEAYISFVEKKGRLKLSDALKRCIQYKQIEFDTVGDYYRLKQEIMGQSPRDITFYLAVKPEGFLSIAGHLSDVGLLEKGNLNHKIIFEKPFGNSLQNAMHIQAHILKLVDEIQIYRIDHYLGKDMIRNILALRFGNRLFEESWKGDVLSSVKIISWETSGVEERLDYYDHAGAINDMVQSHLLQIIALVAMDAPQNFGSESIRRQKLDIMRHMSVSDSAQICVGQYKGYTEAAGFAESKTETYVNATLTVDLPKWKGTSFIVETGKKMKEKRMEVIMTFESNLLCLTEFEAINIKPNVLTIEVYPTEGVHLRFNSKAPGYDFKMDTVEAEYCHTCRSPGNKPEAYVKLLMDAKAGDKTLFAGWEELELQWRIADEIKAAAIGTELMVYEEGSL